jgi:hypothetical protein
MRSWVDATLRRYGPSLERLVGPSWMPLMEPPATGKKASAVKYGCGSFGCVMPTDDPAVVLKITTDPSEAIFASAAIRIGTFPQGIVKLHQIAGASQVNMKRIYQEPRRESAYFLWREAVARPCKPEDFTPAERNRLEKLFQPINAFYRAWIPVQLDPKASIRTHESWARQQLDPIIALRKLDRSQAEDAPLQRASLLYLHLLTSLEKRQTDPLWGHVAEAALFYAKLGLLLYDIDPENIGWLTPDTREPPVLYDVGLSKVIDPTWYGHHIAEIKP